MTTTPAMVSAIVAELDTTITAARQVLFHGGDLTEEEIARYSVNAPALVLAQIGYVNVEAIPTQPRVVARWVLFVVTKKITGQPDRHLLAQTLADGIVTKLVQGEDWGISDAERPMDVGADNLYSSSFDRKGLAVYAVRWDQAYSLDNSADLNLDDFLDLYADWSKVRETADEQPLPVDTYDATDHVELEQ